MRITPIIVTTTVRAPLTQVWRAYTTPADIVQWNAASDDWHTPRATVDLRVGGKFCSRMEAKDGSMGFDFEGTYMQVVPEKLLEYAFGDRKAQATFSDGPQGVTVTITFEAETTHSIEQQRDGWQSILNRFKQHVEALD
nr:SRPBCC family protein [uncultured Rhodoferax sp.]